jgi:hypothetical protein
MPAGEKGSPKILAIQLVVRCENCLATFQLDARWEGMTVDCPFCQTPAKVPKWSHACALNSEKARTSTASNRVQLTSPEIDFLSASDDGHEEKPLGAGP